MHKRRGSEVEEASLPPRKRMDLDGKADVPLEDAAGMEFMNESDAEVPGEDAAMVGEALGHALGTDSSKNAPRSEWNPENFVQLLFEMSDKSGIGKEVRAAVAQWREDATNVTEATEEMDAFLERDVEGWASHCPKSDQLWDKYAPRMAEIIGCDLGDLVKPSRPLFASLCITWHYPTIRTCGKRHFGMVFDTQNPCLNLQRTKIGSSRRVLTLDAFPYRMEPPAKGDNRRQPWNGGRFGWWDEFKKLVLEYQAEFSQYARIRLVLGVDNLSDLRQELAKDESIQIIPIDIVIDKKKIKMFGKTAQFYIIRDKKDQKIKQIVLPSYHLRTLFYRQFNMDGVVATEAMWNIAAGISGLENVNETYFQWKSTQASNGSDKGPSWETYSNSFSLVVQMRKWEIENNVIFEEAIVRKLGGANLWLANAENSARLDPAKGTFVRQVLCAMIQKGVESRRARAAGIKRGPSKKRLLAAAAALRAKAMKVELAMLLKPPRRLACVPRQRKRRRHVRRKHGTWQWNKRLVSRKYGKRKLLRKLLSMRLR